MLLRPLSSGVSWSETYTDVGKRGTDPELHNKHGSDATAKSQCMISSLQSLSGDREMGQACWGLGRGER